MCVCVLQEWSMDLNRTLSRRETKRKHTDGVTLTGINQTTEQTSNTSSSRWAEPQQWSRVCVLEWLSILNTRRFLLTDSDMWPLTSGVTAATASPGAHLHTQHRNSTQTASSALGERKHTSLNCNKLKSQNREMLYRDLLDTKNQLLVKRWGTFNIFEGKKSKLRHHERVGIMRY